MTSALRYFVEYSRIGPQVAFAAPAELNATQLSIALLLQVHAIIYWSTESLMLMVLPATIVARSPVAIHQLLGTIRMLYPRTSIVLCNIGVLLGLFSYKYIFEVMPAWQHVTAYIENIPG